MKEEDARELGKMYEHATAHPTTVITSPVLPKYNVKDIKKTMEVGKASQTRYLKRLAQNLVGFPVILDKEARHDVVFVVNQNVWDALQKLKGS